MLTLPGKSFFSPPKPQPLPEPVTREDPAIKQRKDEEKQARIRRKGFRQTVVNEGGGLGDTSAPNTERKTLLGS